MLRVEKPETGLEIVRDKHDIPHIYGTTRGDAMFGSGWVAAEDRGLLLALGLGPAYTAALGVPGLNAFGLLLEQRGPSSRAQKRSNTSQRRRKCSKKRAPKACR